MLKNTCKSLPGNTYGFTLIELMVVVAIVGILAIGVVFMFADPAVKVKGQAFTILGDLNMARSEAVNRNTDVWVTFLPGAAAADQDGYQIWIDEDDDSIYTAGNDTLIRETFFPEEVQFYDIDATDGPDLIPPPNPDANALIMDDGDSDDDGIEFDGANEFIFTPMGTAKNTSYDPLENTGYVLIYYPVSAADHANMRAAPYAVAVLPGVGSIRISRWNTRDSAWKRK